MTSPLLGYSSHFGLDNIPFGVASSQSNIVPSCVTRYQDNVIFLKALPGLYDEIPELPLGILDRSTLDDFAALPRHIHTRVRERIQHVIRQDTPLQNLPPAAVSHISDVEMHLPVNVGDFTDFSCSHDHVQNASEAMTGQRSTPPAFFHMPIGYAGRCSSIDISGVPVERPLGLHWKGKPMQSEVIFGPSEKMDYELEVGCIIGQPIARRERVLASQAEKHIFGYVLINDWSARDIQALEMMPLGPLNGKNAGTTMSPWVITPDALAPFKASAPPRTQSVSPYLEESGDAAVSISLQVDVKSSSQGDQSRTLCRSNSSWMYWSLAQCVAHQTIGGCGLRTGDLLATGTVSGGGDDEHGCLMEYMKLDATPPRGYLEDGETVTLSGFCGEGVGFGECVATLQPAKEL
ncbi:related to fumarylacetoacetate hydrolase family protein [Ramularia collo-cygni]|uniref:Fumarylacetoacetase n=1 Tax=Ramularia collo-cygni TaxID=112498 RepID=A0A2D3UPP0_9PEZI|nr:related to fumarylacetoacetate hydrolase family protein [Ramularia collo-cygni]CZT18552.1 related to fumarylacetoacetate hydrolase family protein [Ramularia collo-cygni]